MSYTVALVRINETMLQKQITPRYQWLNTAKICFFTHAESAAGSGALQAHSFQAGIQDLMVFHPVTLASEHILAMVEERVV